MEWKEHFHSAWFQNVLHTPGNQDRVAPVEIWTHRSINQISPEDTLYTLDQLFFFFD